jgi:hypothetical protein
LQKLILLSLWQLLMVQSIQIRMEIFILYD